MVADDEAVDWYAMTVCSFETVEARFARRIEDVSAPYALDDIGIGGWILWVKRNMKVDLALSGVFLLPFQLLVF